MDELGRNNYCCIEYKFHLHMTLPINIIINRHSNKIAYVIRYYFFVSKKTFPYLLLMELYARVVRVYELF